MSKARRWSSWATVAVAVALGAIALSSVALAKVSGHTLVTANCRGHAYKPAKVTFACADNGFFATGLSWSKWTKTNATGSGIGHINTCKPNCAAGNFKKGKLKVALSKTVVCTQDGKRHFTKAVYTWPNGAPVGPDTAKTSFPCSLIGP
jgi:hypothetical protein